jgi:hypothetical protein
MRSIAGAVLVILLASPLLLAGEQPATTQPATAPSISRTIPNDRVMPGMNFNRIGLKDVIDFIREVTGFNIFVDYRSLQAVGVPEESSITAQIQNEKLSVVLTKIIEDVAHDDGDYGVSDGIIVISSTDGLESLWDADAKWAKATAGVAEKLDRNFPELKCSKNTFSDVVDLLREISGANIYVDWAALEKAKISKDAPISLSLRNVSFLKALRLIMWEAGGPDMEITVDQNVLTITAKAPK